MAFPIDPLSETIDARGLFLVQDADLLARVLPLFSFNPDIANARPIGHGSTFRIDPWSRCVTAFHVIEELFELKGAWLTLKPDFCLSVLEHSGLRYGVVPIDENAWRPLAGSHSIVLIEQPFIGDARLGNATELAALRIRPPAAQESGTPYLPIDLRRWHPRKGERVLALGYAELDCDNNDKRNAGATRPISQSLYGSLGQITDIELADGKRSRPWPMIRIDANWPGGMSGGPVFNEAGHVIGVVSTGFHGEGGATATYFSGWDIPGKIFGSIDPDNPGRFRCWGAFDGTGNLARAGQDKAAVELFGFESGLSDFGWVSVDPATDEWVR